MGAFVAKRSTGAIGSYSKIKAEHLFYAEVFGNAAHKNGIKRIPALDKEFIDWMATLNLNIGEGGVLLMKKWGEGWDYSNLQ